MLLYIDDPARFIDELSSCITDFGACLDLDEAIKLMKKYQRADNQPFVVRKEDWSGCCC